VRGYAFAFARWLAVCQRDGLTYYTADYRNPATAFTWHFMNGFPPDD